jgi:hypothetical protein
MQGQDPKPNTAHQSNVKAQAMKDLQQFWARHGRPSLRGLLTQLLTAAALLVVGL